VGRRRARLAAAVAIAAALPAAWWWSTASAPITAGATAVVAQIAAEPHAVVVHDDLGVLARCAVASVERDTWYVDDHGLQQLLQQAGLDSGLIRAGGRLLAVAAVESLPVAP
jgi:hypothetical protein